MEPQIVINALFGLAGVLCGAILKAVWDAITRLQRDMVVLQESIGRTYVRRDDFKDFTDRVTALLDKIYDKLDAKADKP